MQGSRVLNTIDYVRITIPSNPKSPPTNPIFLALVTLPTRSQYSSRDDLYRGTAALDFKEPNIASSENNNFGYADSTSQNGQTKTGSLPEIF